jgi:hypothetical protein
LEIADLVEIAVDENDVPFLLRETRMRVVNLAQSQTHLDLLATEYVFGLQDTIIDQLAFNIGTV